MWQLKKNQSPFEVVDGPMAGRSYAHGKRYTEIPPGMEVRFERQIEARKGSIPEQPAPASVPASKKKNKPEEENLTDAE